MEIFKREMIKVKKIQDRIRSEMTNNYFKAFSTLEKTKKGLQFNIEEFVDLFNYPVIINFYIKYMEHELDDGELLLKKILDINKIIKDKLGFFPELANKKSKYFNFDIISPCIESEFYLSLKNIRFLQNINSYDINIKIYAITKVYNINDFIVFNKDISMYDLEILIFGDETNKPKSKNKYKNII